MPVGNAAGNGDRLPTRERGYRSANHYVRRRAAMPVGINNGLEATNPEIPDEDGGLGAPVDISAMGKQPL